MLVIICLSLLSLFAIPSVNADDCVNVYKLDKETCGDLCLSKYISGFAIKFGGVYSGSCKDINYTIFDHTEKISVGPFGDYEVTIYRKETKTLSFLEEFLPLLKNEIFLSLGDDCQTIYKLDKETCGELCLSKYIAGFAIKLGGVTAGACKDINYTIFDHTEKISVGPFGEFEVTLYKK